MKVLKENGGHLDALVIIRGGGSKMSLAWLDDYDLTRHLCSFPIPIFTGIGHQTDKCLLDEVSNLSFDTPSKVIAYIQGNILNNGLECLQELHTIRSIYRQLLQRKRTIVDVQFKSTMRSSKYLLVFQTQNLIVHHSNVVQSAINHFHDMKQCIELHYNNTQRAVSHTHDMASDIDRLIRQISNSWKRQILSIKSSAIRLFTETSYFSKLHVHRQT